MRTRTARGEILRAVFVCGVGGCSLGYEDTTPETPTYADPEITAASVECDPERPRWTFDVTASAWTGNGQVLLSADGSYIERHRLDSISAEADGSTDQLQLKLDVVADWRDVSEGSTTVFNCDEPFLDGVIRVYSRTGDAVTDCRAFGTDPARWATWEPDTACATVLEGEDSGGSAAGEP